MKDLFIGMYTALVDNVRSLRPALQELRAPGFYYFVGRVLQAFEHHPDLLSLKVVATATYEAEIEPRRSTLIVTHHQITIETVGTTVPYMQGENLEGFIVDHLPYEIMDEGTIEIKRDDESVQAFLSSDLNDPGLLVHEIAIRMAFAFTMSDTFHRLHAGTVSTSNGTEPSKLRLVYNKDGQ